MRNRKSTSRISVKAQIKRMVYKLLRFGFEVRVRDKARTAVR